MPSSRPDLRRTAPLAAASQSPVVVPEETSGGGLLTWIILTAFGGAMAVCFIARGRNATDAPPPDSTPPAPADKPPAASAVSPADDTTLS